MKPNITDDLLKQLRVSCSSETQLSTLVPNFERKAQLYFKRKDEIIHGLSPSVK